jgi:hypothetical protein
MRSNLFWLTDEQSDPPSGQAYDRPYGQTDPKRISTIASYVGSTMVGAVSVPLTVRNHFGFLKFLPLRTVNRLLRLTSFSS